MFFYLLFLLILISILIYFNVNNPLNNPFFISIYPYVLVFVFIYIIAILVIQFVDNTFILGFTYSFMFIFLVFSIYSFLKIWKNLKLCKKNNLYKNSYENSSKSFNNEVIQMYDGNIMFDQIIEEIKKAKNHIHIEFYIFRNHSIAEKLKSVLIQKAEEGIEVRIIYDGIGNLMLKKSYIKDLKAVGAEMKVYDSVFKSIIKGTLNHRNHRKMVIVDGIVGFAGGINVGDEYLGRDKSVGKWNDSLVKIKGEAVKSMQKIFLNDWRHVSNKNLESKKYFPDIEVKNNLPIKIISSGYNPFGNEISKEYFSIITSAKKDLYIVTPYLALSNKMMEGLTNIAEKGVKVKIILPKKTNHFFASWVNSTFYKKLIKSDIKIYLHEDGFLHSKIIVADSEVLSIGSANLDTRAQYLDYEINAVLFDKNQGNKMIEQINKYINKSKLLTMKEYNKRSLIEKIKEKIGIILRPIV